MYIKTLTGTARGYPHHRSYRRSETGLRTASQRAGTLLGTLIGAQIQGGGVLRIYPLTLPSDLLAL